MTLPSPDGLQITLTLTTLAVIWIGWVKVAGPRVKRGCDRVVGIFQAIAGREAIVDKASGKELAPAVPPLGEQLSSINDTMAKLVAVVESNHDAHRRIDNVVVELGTVKRDVDDLKTAAVERIEIKRESAEMWRAVANRDVIDADSDEPSGEL